MSRKVTGIIAALLLAAIGTTILVRYVQSAEDRALEGEELVPVYVIADDVPAGTEASEIEDFVDVQQVPVKVRAEGAVTDLAELEELVAEVDLSPGEQLLGSRFVARQAFESRPAGLSIPSGLVEVTVSLAPERAVGGLIAPGDTVAVVASFEPFDINTSAVEIDGQIVALPDELEDETIKTPNTTHILLHKVLVTSMQIERRPSTNDDDDGDGIALAPTGNLLVTLAVAPPEAERLLFTAEFGRLWLAAEGLDVPEEGTQIQTRSSVYDDPAVGRLQ